MPDLIELLTFESHKLVMAAPHLLKHRLKEKIKKLVREPFFNEAAMIKAMKEVQRELDLHLRSHPDRERAMVGAMIVYCVLLREEVRQMVHLDHQHPDMHLLRGHVNNVFRLQAMIQPLLKEANAHQIEELEEALRRIH